MSHRRAGFSLVEMMIALGMFSVLGLGLAMASRAGSQASETVATATTENGNIRDVTRLLVQELTTARDADIVVNALLDGNDEMTFSVPVVVGGAPDWGVYDTSLGLTEADWNRAGWRFRYAARQVFEGGQLVDRVLVRQILDDTGVVQQERALLAGLSDGVDPAGFTVRDVGDVWELTITTTRNGGGTSGRRMVVHVHTRND